MWAEYHTLRWLFRAYIAGQDGFLDAVKGVEEAQECLEDALAAHIQDRGGRVEPGKQDIWMHTLPNIFLPPDHQINWEMIMLVSPLHEFSPVSAYDFIF